MVPGFGVSAECQSIGTSGKKQGAFYLAPKTLSWFIFCAFIPRLWFSYSHFQQVRQPSISSPVEEDMPKIRDTIGTVFIQGPSIVLLVWRCIRFNDSYLRACIKLRFVKKIRFCLYSRAIDSEPRGRRYVKNTGNNRNRLYSRVLHCPASMCVGYYGL